MTLRYLFALFLYGTIGFFLHFVEYSSEFVVLCRGVLGSLFIYIIMKINKQAINFDSIRKNLRYLCISGVSLGLNWVFLFQGYEYGVAVTSVCNYLAPIIVVVICLLVYKERINKVQIVCIISAFVGILLMTGIFDYDSVDYRCVVYGLLAAVGFVIMVLCNKKIDDIDQYDKTLSQLFFSVVVVFPYVYFHKGFPVSFDLRSTLIVIMLGILHTGVAYIFYFSAIRYLSSQSIAVLGYLEPVINVLIGSFVFKEKMTVMTIIGIIMILCASIGNELFANKE